jgi:hypothetical protein
MSSTLELYMKQNKVIKKILEVVFLNIDKKYLFNKYSIAESFDKYIINVFDSKSSFLYKSYYYLDNNEYVSINISIDKLENKICEVEIWKPSGMPIYSFPDNEIIYEEYT